MDGGSNDSSVDILKSYPHLIWKSEIDKGQSDAMNKAFEISTGDIIVYLNADDFFKENIFDLIINMFHHNPKADMIVGNGEFYKNGVVTYKWNAEISYRKCLLHYKYTFPLNAFSYFYKRSVQEFIGGFNINNDFTMDYEFLLHAFKNFRIKKINHSLGYFFFDDNNKTATINPLQLCTKTAIEFCKKHDWFGLIYYKICKYNLPVRVSMKIYKIFSIKPN